MSCTTSNNNNKNNNNDDNDDDDIECSPLVTAPTLSELMIPGNTAVVTGASSGIGKAACMKFVQYGMNCWMIDIDHDELIIAHEQVSQEIKKRMQKQQQQEQEQEEQQEQFVRYEIVDVSDLNAMSNLADKVFAVNDDDGTNCGGGCCHILMNNAGIGIGGNSMTDIDIFNKVMNVNTYGPIHGCLSFIPKMKKAFMIKKTKKTKTIDDDGNKIINAGIVINTGSKQGITMPPGNLSYNVSKAALKCYTEGLEHELMLERYAGVCNIRAVLLIPGWVNTNILLKSQRTQAIMDGQVYDDTQCFFHEKKPASGAWMPKQIIDYLIQQLDDDDDRDRFYVLCPDNEIPHIHMDHMRMRWTMDDIIYNRPPLSRWHPKYKQQYQQFISSSSSSSSEEKQQQEQQHQE